MLVLSAGVFMLVSVVVLSGLLLWNSYRSAYEAAELRANASAHVIAANFQWIIEASDQTLRRLDVALQQRGNSALPETIANIDEMVGNLPRGFQYAIYDSRGNLTYSSIDGAARIRVEDRNYFRRLVDGDELVISDQLDERLTGDKVFVIARRITIAGEFAGAVSIAVPISRMQELWESLGLSWGSTASLLRSDGMLVARYPVLDSPAIFQSAKVFEELEDSPEGSYFATSEADGADRMVGYWKLDRWPVVAIVGLGYDDFLAEFWRQVRFWIAFGAPTLLIVVVMMAWIARLLHRDQERGLVLAEAYEHNEFLMREIHHRVKNNLQIVASLVRLQKMPSQEKESLNSRIAAMVAIHEEVYRSDQFETVEMAPYLRKLVGEITAAYGRDAEVNLDLEEIRMNGSRAMQLGLLLNELVSNSFKHGMAPDGGKLDISLKRLEDDKVELIVRDNGPGYDPDEVADSSDSMGGKLIAAFVMQLEAELDIGFDDGTVAAVRFEG